MLLKTKEEISEDVYVATKDVITKMMNNYQYISYNSIMSQLAEMIAVAVQVGVTTAIDNMYTDQDFERDTGLDRDNI